MLSAPHHQPDLCADTGRRRRMTGVDVAVKDASDIELVGLARKGQSEALAELWARHYKDTVQRARRWTGSHTDAEDVASEVFSRMISAIADGGGPTGSVAGYLSMSSRNLAINRSKSRESSNVSVAEPALYVDTTRGQQDPVFARVEHAMVREAFNALPARWRVVLWRTAVDRHANRHLATEMGMTANAVAALAVRARAGFRTSYLNVHVSHGNVEPQCQPFLPLLPGLVSGTRPNLTLNAHLDECDRCRERVAELFEVERHFGAFLLPGVLLAALGRIRTVRRPSLSSHSTKLAVAGAVMVAAAGLAHADSGTTASTRARPAAVSATTAPAPVSTAQVHLEPPVKPTPPVTGPAPEPPTQASKDDSRQEGTSPRKPRPVTATTPDPTPTAPAPAPDPTPTDPAPTPDPAPTDQAPAPGPVTPTTDPEADPTTDPEECHPNNGADPDGCHNGHHSNIGHHGNGGHVDDPAAVGPTAPDLG